MASQVSSHKSTPHAFNKEMKTVKELVESTNITSLPKKFAFFAEDQSAFAFDSDSPLSLPVIDFGLLTSGTPDQQSKMIAELGKACQDWGFFSVVNHGVPESLMKAMIEKIDEFFNLPPEDKQAFEGKHVLDPIRSGTSFNTSAEEVSLWRDFLKVMVHPQFHSPPKPHGFSEISSEYSNEVWRVAETLLKKIFKSLDLDEEETAREINLDMGLQVLVANYYPPCPQPELAIGLPPHSDHGLLTLLVHNQVGGFQIFRNGKWVAVDTIPNSFLVNIADHIEILSNGKYKSLLHRAIVNDKATRMSVAITNGPSLDTVIGPASQLIDRDGAAYYKAMPYKEYLERQQSKKLHGKTGLNMVRLE